jgi:stage II sporulation protein D
VDSATGVSLSGPPPLPPGPRLESPSVPGLVAIGRGFGHGVGMSQWGAYGMARRGEGFEGILRHFYRGAVVGPFRDLTAQVPATLMLDGPLPGPAVLANRERP